MCNKKLIFINNLLNYQQVDSILPTIRSELKKDFVPNFVNHIRSRDDLISHCTPLSKILFYPDNLQKIVLIWDGTYIFIEKSSQHYFQKLTYNSHKKRNYIKPMIIVTTDGTIVCVLGPFKAVENDAKMTKKILMKDIPALQNLQKEDVMIVDRGFRDCVTNFKNFGFLVEIPSSKTSTEQLSVIEANKARLITKVRYEVERINGMIKNRFKIFANVWESYSIPHLMDDLTIASAFLNKFHTRRRVNENAEEIGREMLARLHKKNILSQITGNFHFKSMIKHKQYEPFNSFEIFPQLTMNDLEAIAFGSYQIQQAKLYAYEHIKACNNIFELFVFPEEITRKYWIKIGNENIANPVLILSFIKSRFIKIIKHETFVLFDRNGSTREAIGGYCCSCKIGLRTIGCCSHTMTILYYLGFAHRNGGTSKVAKHLDNVFSDFESDE